MALKVQKELTKQKELFQLEGNIPSVEEVFKHYVTHTEKKEKLIAFRGSKFEKFEKLAPVFKVDHTSDYFKTISNTLRYRSKEVEKSFDEGK